MKKQLVIIGIIALLVCVGLSGCNEQSSKVISTNEILNHPNKFINQTVTVQGTYLGGSASYYWIMGPSSLYAVDSNGVEKPTPVVYGAVYKFTGIARYGHLPGSFFSDMVYLEVTKIETT